jgi:hypothetical protein
MYLSINILNVLHDAAIYREQLQLTDEHTPGVMRVYAAVQGNEVRRRKGPRFSYNV